MLFELLEFVFEEIVDIVGDLFESASDAATDTATDAVGATTGDLSLVEVLPADGPPLDSLPADGLPIDGLPVDGAPSTRVHSGGGSVAAMDGGISPDRFDPKPRMGAYAP